MELANNLKYYREKAGFTQEQVITNHTAINLTVGKWQELS